MVAAMFARGTAIPMPIALDSSSVSRGMISTPSLVAASPVMDLEVSISRIS